MKNAIDNLLVGAALLALFVVLLPYLWAGVQWFVETVLIILGV